MKLTSPAIVFLLLYFFSISCEIKAQPLKSFEKDSITAIMISRNFPWMTNEGKLICYEPENAFLFLNKNWVLYKIPYDFSIHKLSDSGIYGVDKIEKRTRYLVREQGDSIGYFTDSSFKIFSLKCSIDSVFTQFWPIHPFIEPMLDEYHYRLIDSLTRHSGKSYYNTYFFQNKTEPLQKGTFTLEFLDSFPFVDYSLCQRLDTLKGMKLVNLEIFNEARYVEKYNITIDAVDQFQRLTSFKDFNLSEITPFFEFMQRRNQKNN